MELHNILKQNELSQVKLLCSTLSLSCHPRWTKNANGLTMETSGVIDYYDKLPAELKT